MFICTRIIIVVVVVVRRHSNFQTTKPTSADERLQSGKSSEQVGGFVCLSVCLTINSGSRR